jgi:hypothetical protein
MQNVIPPGFEICSYYDDANRIYPNVQGVQLKNEPERMTSLTTLHVLMSYTICNIISPHFEVGVENYLLKRPDNAAQLL